MRPILLSLFVVAIWSCQPPNTDKDVLYNTSVTTFSDVPDDTVTAIKLQLTVCFDTICSKLLKAENECKAMELLLFTRDRWEMENQAAYDWLWSQMVKHEMERYWKSEFKSDKYLDPLLDNPSPNELDNLCEVLNKVDEMYESYFDGPQYSMNLASGVMASTSNLRLLFTYHTLDSLLRNNDQNLLAASYYKDYELWEDLFKEYEENYTDAGSASPMILNQTYSTFADMRNDLLNEEIGYFTENGRAALWLSQEGDFEWDVKQKAIHRWYDYRMAIVDKMEQNGYGNNTIEYYKHITYKAVYIYQRLKTGWSYYFEQL